MRTSRSRPSCRPSRRTRWPRRSPRCRPSSAASSCFREIVGLSYEEIAARVDSTVASVQMLLFRARRSLREVLDPPVVSRRKTGAWFADSRLADRTGVALRGCGPDAARRRRDRRDGFGGARIERRRPTGASGRATAVAGRRADAAARLGARQGRCASGAKGRAHTVGLTQAPVDGSRAADDGDEAEAHGAPRRRRPSSRPRSRLWPQRLRRWRRRPARSRSSRRRSASVPTKSVAVPLPVPGVLPPELTVPVPDVQLPVDPQQVVPKLPVPVPVPPLPSPTQVVEVAAGAAGAAGASAPPLPVPSVPLVALPQAP